MELTDKQQRFCQEYLIDLNATQAAIRSGYKEKTARQIGSKNLSKSCIQEFIAKLMEELQEATKTTAEDVINELIKIGYSNIANYYDPGLQLKEITSLHPSLTKVIQSIKVTRTVTKEGAKIQQVELKLHDKLEALEKLAKHFGIYAPKKIDVRSLKIGLDAESIFEEVYV